MRIFASLLLLTVFILPVFSQETFTLTTYYPAPFGIYQRLVTTALGVGDTNDSGDIDAADAPDPATPYLQGDVWVDGNIGIGGYALTEAAQQIRLFIQDDETVNVNGQQVAFALIKTARDNAVAVLGLETGAKSWQVRSDFNGEFNIMDVGEPPSYYPGRSRLTIVSDGDVGIGATSPSDGTSSGGQDLRLDVEGAVGATHYCDENGENCVTPPFGSPIVGTYTGNGGIKRINLGFRPGRVEIVWWAGATKNIMKAVKIDGMPGANTYVSGLSGSYAVQCIRITDSGFSVQGTFNFNTSGTVYNFTAQAASENVNIP